MSTELYEIRDFQTREGTLSCEIVYNDRHEIFNGHFPGNPIVPGVCTMQMIGDLLQQALQKSIRLTQAANIKYLQLITPAMRPLAHIAWNASGDHFLVTATLKDNAQALFKMSGTYAIGE